ncbi:3-oxoacyl-[acyl-carrier protein] reductase [Thermocatellispora tengchongensis]|uniref:3-oxoacyl-[acyl-carrier protein] reductase n=1 Tax=Thermocatellispora tengchongensis TaxID=1073253 RepID=A0A840PAB9_9ACTN|nr:SDR family oxidoreductase [Thermocatellispora tengchongensis]MBB5132945.1 3-oxoacyl-[acyl-carrier protein] reductase [Thermocatellispora tengchongensis]
MDLGIQGRVALVCAATSGLGEASARALGAERARVVIGGRRAELAAGIAAELPEAAAAPGDLLDPAVPRRLVATAEEMFGPIDILVLNGPGPAPGTAAAMDGAAITAAVDSLLRPQQELVSLVLPGMRERGWGRIVAIGSSGVAAPLPNLASSNVGRWALAAYLKTLATEVAADGVTVNMVLPGRIATDRMARLDAARAEREGRTVAEVSAESAAAIPARRHGHPSEFGAAVAFLCSAQASYITGVALRVDGGLVNTL